ncbi:MAG: H+transporting two-sector ATPase delta/epsilon subunit [Gammaproteobacteria bacterium]|nr:H+transporting two-sector ATPase delta/epsilon subunit [Gammaproteobacteria bacterium]
MLHDRRHAELLMKTFRLLLRDTIRNESIGEVCSFIGEDDSGSFGILADHTRFMTRLVFGLARFKVVNAPWQYLAVPGAMLYFHNNELILITRRYLRSDNYLAISKDLMEILSVEERNLLEMKRNLHRIDEHILSYMRDFEARTPEL